MDWWYIVWGLLLGWSIPWAILRISDGAFLLNQIFRFVFWGSFLISYELVELNLIYLLHFCRSIIAPIRHCPSPKLGLLQVDLQTLLYRSNHHQRLPKSRSSSSPQQPVYDVAM